LRNLGGFFIACKVTIMANKGGIKPKLSKSTAAVAAAPVGKSVKKTKPKGKK
jgi:hypothetical protein